MTDKPSLFVVLSRFPYPLEKGDKLRAYHQLEDLAKTYELHVFALTDKPVSPENRERVEQLCASLEIARLSKAGLFLPALWALIFGKPFQVAYFYRFGIQRKINRKLRDLKPGFIYCQLVRVSEYVKNYHQCRKTIDYMDALSEGMARRAGKSKGLYKWFFTIEASLLKSYERSMFDYFEHRVIISEQDRKLILHPERAQIAIIPNGVDTAFFHPEDEKPREYDLLFTGNFSYAPNIEAAEYLVNEILPALERKSGKSYKVLLAGATPAPRVRNLASETVIVSGWMDDIRQAYWNARIFVAPLFIGTGLQNKLLEAMASGLPVIATPLAINAFQQQDQLNLLLAEDSAEFVEKITLLEADMSIFTNTRINGRDFVTNYYSWSKQNLKLSKLISHF